MSAARLLTCLESSRLGRALTDDVKRSLDRLLASKPVVGRTPLGTRGELWRLAAPRGSVTSSSDTPIGQCRRRAVLGKTRCPVRRGGPEDTRTANPVEAPDRKELANSPEMPKLVKSGLYSTGRSIC